MTQPPDLAEVLAAHAVWDELDDRDGPAMVRCRCDVDNPHITNGVEDGGWMPRAEHHKHQAQAWRDACTISTAAELDALPVDSIVLSVVPPGARIDAIYDKNDDGTWNECDTEGHRLPAECVSLPVQLIWSPEWAR